MTRYLEGKRVPSDRAGHYHPDVVRICDFKIGPRYFRLTYCDHCGYRVRRIRSTQYSREASTPEQTALYRKRYRAMMAGQQSALGELVTMAQFERLALEDL